MSWLRLRTVILNDDARDEYDKCCDDYPRFDEAWDGFVWLVSRNARPAGSFPTTHKGESYMIYGWSSQQVPGLMMWTVYAYNDDEVVVYGINAIPQDEEDADEPEE